ncbi:MAG: ABC transporter permease, partial [Gammaproteobacteria bacterium]|nr:ABC transporter permease [Gammaproteobacteria bacterium]
LLICHSGSVILTVAALVGAVVTGGTFAVIALILLRGGRVIGMQAGSTWRLALAGLQRRYRENVAQIVIFGFAIMLLLVMLLVRTALVEDWQAEIPESTPNHFLMNVMPSEAEAVQRLLTERTDYDGALFPMIRGRISAVNEVPAREWRRRLGPRPPGPGIRSERNLTFSADLPDNNVVVEGEWWPADGPRGPAASLEDEYASSIGVSVGDTLTLDIGGLPLTVPVTNLRSVEWDSLQPNFFIIFSPGTLDEYPATFMTSFHLSREEKPFLNELLSAHPTITLIEVDEIINQVRSIIDRVTQTVELVLYLVLGAGVLVLIASIGSSRDQRLREHALLRALGGTRPLIQGALVTEFAILGVFAGIVAVIGAEITVFALNREIFELPTSLHFWLWATGPAIGMAMIATVGYLGTRKLVSSPPATVLREV